MINKAISSNSLSDQPRPSGLGLPKPMTKRESLCHDPLNSLTGLQVKSPNQNANEQAYKDIVPVKIDPVEIPVLENTLQKQCTLDDSESEENVNKIDDSPLTQPKLETDDNSKQIVVEPKTETDNKNPSITFEKEAPAEEDLNTSLHGDPVKKKSVMEIDLLSGDLMEVALDTNSDFNKRGSENLIMSNTEQARRESKADLVNLVSVHDIDLFQVTEADLEEERELERQKKEAAKKEAEESEKKWLEEEVNKNKKKGFDIIEFEF